MSQGGLGGGDTPARLRTFVQQTNITFPILLTHGRTFPYRLGAQTAPFPIDVIIDKKGNIAYAAGRYDAAAMKQIVERELAR